MDNKKFDEIESAQKRIMAQPFRISYEKEPGIDGAEGGRMAGHPINLMYGITELTKRLVTRMEEKGFGPAEKHIDFLFGQIKNAVREERKEKQGPESGSDFLKALARMMEEGDDRTDLL